MSTALLFITKRYNLMCSNSKWAMKFQHYKYFKIILIIILKERKVSHYILLLILWWHLKNLEDRNKINQNVNYSYFAKGVLKGDFPNILYWSL